LSDSAPLPNPILFQAELGQNQPLPEDGLYLFNKPKGISSFGAVYILRRELKQKYGKKIKVGHCGTLDPLATGLLILLSGKLTKRAGELTKKDKVYLATAKLGASSTTYDSEGQLSLVSSSEPSRVELEQALTSFLGKSQQIPPIFSAIKLSGKRAYQLARAGQEVKLKPRPIQIYSIQLLEYNYPELKFSVHVSSGTYIRSLIHDLGLKLSTGAHMTDLHRQSISTYTLSNPT
jgi:tRNA pseudouridine55 synthase